MLSNSLLTNLPFSLIIAVFLVAIILLLSKIKSLEDRGVAKKNTLNKIEEDYFSLQDKKNILVSVIDNFKDAAIILDHEQRIISFNNQAQNILKISKERLLYKKISELNAYGDINVLLPLLARAGSNTLKKEIQVNQSLILEVFIAPVMHNTNNLGTLILLADVTQIRRSQKAKADFVSLTIHQLSTPLSTIKLSLQMLLSSAYGKINKEQKEVIEKSYQRSNMLLHMIRDLLNLDKMNGGGYSYRFSLVDFEGLITLVMGCNQEEIKKKKLTVVYEKPKQKMGPIVIDKEKICLAMQNMFDNAVKYSKEGGKITLLTEENSNMLTFKVQDTGIGIPGDQKEKLFTKFFRASNALTLETLGSGLGLFIIKTIIEGHGGKVGFESEENKGSSFYFTLPINHEKSVE